MQEDSIRSTGPVPGMERVSGSRRLAALIAAGLQMRAMGLPRVCNRNTATLPVIIGFLGIFKAQQRSGCCGCRRSRSAHFIGIVAMLRFGSLLLAIRREVTLECVVLASTSTIIRACPRHRPQLSK